MPDGPLTYLRKRLARSIDFRVRSATQVAADAQRTEIAQRFDELGRAQQEHSAHHEEQNVENRTEITELLDQLRRARDADSDARDALRRELAEEFTTMVSALHASLGSVSASIADAQRQQSDFLEHLARRVEALEHSLGHS
jgi:uncharacterized protein YjgD (DUF1641 family)